MPRPTMGGLTWPFSTECREKNLLPLVLLVRSGKHVGREGVVLKAATSIELSAPDGFPCHADGDIVDVRFPMKVQVIPKAVPFVANGRA